MKSIQTLIISLGGLLPLLSPAAALDLAEFQAGFAAVDITPSAPVPLWGYGMSNRAENVSTGTHDPLFAKALVIEASEKRLALVGLDLGRAPFEPMVRRLQVRLRAEANIEHVLFVGSHTHHGPALELVPVEGLPDPAVDNALAYYVELEARLLQVVLDAASRLEAARIGWASGETSVNRNRHTKEEPVPRDGELFVLRVDNADGEPIALAVNMAAHPTTHPPANNQFSADFPGVMMKAVESATGIPTMFLQGAAGDMQCVIDDSRWGEVDQMEAPGLKLAEEVLALNAGLATAVPAHPDLQGAENTFSFGMRFDLEDPEVTAGVRAQYGEYLYASYIGKHRAGTIHPKLITVLLNGELAIAGGSGEFFSDLSVQLKQSVPEPKTIFVGYCNGHDMYFATRRAMEQGGYGADPPTAWVAPGGPETMMERAAHNIGEHLRAFRREHSPAE